MNLQHLFSVLPEAPEKALSHLQVTGLFNDARKVLPGSVFVAIRGVKFDGHNFIPEAVSKGVAALVVEDKNKVPENFDGIVLTVPNTREALDVLAARYYGDPAQELFCVGVTGTNGKTSVTYMVEAILNFGKISTGVIGTVNHHLGNKVWPSDLTTPDPIFLQKRLREFRDEGAQAVAMEVSSHALDQHRVDSIPFNAVIFTNLTRDHLDYHQTMENYFGAKQKLFTDLLWRTTKKPSFAIINTDDKLGRRLQVADPATLWTYGAKGADFGFKIKYMDFTSTHFQVMTPAGAAEVQLPMSGVHNVMNALAALAVGVAAGIPLATCAEALTQFRGVPGRLQSVPNTKKISIFVDYAHTPDALENVLIALTKVRENLKAQARIWTIFGCGGDRDKGKRPLMAQMALKYSDEVVITSDNPRTENPQSIINDILEGVSDKTKVRTITDRRMAILEALNKVQEGDVVLIAGKGHEDYQIVGTEKIPFSDLEIAEQALREKA